MSRHWQVKRRVQHIIPFAFAAIFQLPQQRPFLIKDDAFFAYIHEFFGRIGFFSGMKSHQRDSPYPWQIQGEVQLYSESPGSTVFEIGVILVTLHLKIPIHLPTNGT